VIRRGQRGVLDPDHFSVGERTGPCGPGELGVRRWTCLMSGAGRCNQQHGRITNAARNIWLTDLASFAGLAARHGRAQAWPSSRRNPPNGRSSLVAGGCQRPIDLERGSPLPVLTLTALLLQARFPL